MERFAIGRGTSQTGRGETYYVYDRERLAMLNHDSVAVSGHAPNVDFTIEQARDLVARLNAQATNREDGTQ